MEDEAVGVGARHQEPVYLITLLLVASDPVFDCRLDGVRRVAFRHEKRAVYLLERLLGQVQVADDEVVPFEIKITC